MVRDVDVELFVWLGLSEVEAKIYLTLLEMGETSAEAISKQTKISQLEVQSALKALQKIGIVHEATANNPPFLNRPTNSSKRKKWAE
jgi:sugar-specific transcriptional regulator TrmB